MESRNNMRRFANLMAMFCLAVGTAGADAFDDLMGYTYEDQPEQLGKAAEDLLAKTPRDQMGAVEAKLVAVVASTNTAPEAKAYACRLLQRIGTAACVSAVTTLLHDEELAAYARMTLERQGTEAAAAALRAALDDVPENAKPGILGSLGAMQDAKAVAAMRDLAGSTNAATAGAAILALGKVGDRHAAAALVKLDPPPSLREAVAAALIDCGKRMGGNVGVKLCERAMADGTAANRVAAIEAIATLDAGRGADFIVADLRGDDRERAAAARTIVAGVPGATLTHRLTAVLDELPSAKQVALLTALGQRGDRAALPAVEGRLTVDDEAVRAAAIAAVARLGDAGSVKQMLSRAAAGGDSPELVQAIAAMPGAAIDAVLIDALGSDAVRGVAIEAAVQRDLTEAAPRLLECVKADDLRVQSAAWKALGSLGGVEQLGPMLTALADLDERNMQDTAFDATARIVTAARDRRKAFVLVLEQYDKASVSVKTRILNLAAAVGGEAALARVSDALASGEGEVYDAALRSLARWPNEQAAGKLLELATQAAGETHRILALRGCIRIAGAREVRLSREQRLALYREAGKAARRTDEKRLILAGLRDLRDKDALPVLFGYLEDAALIADTANSVIDVARDIAPQHKAEARAALDKLMAHLDGAECDGAITKRARELQSKLQ